MLSVTAAVVSGHVIGLCTDQLTATTLRQIYAQSHPETQSFLLGHSFKSNALTNIHSEAAEALHAHKLVVVLESTVMTHGMPYPVNLERSSLLGGKLGYWKVYLLKSVSSTDVKIGLEPHELERLAECKNKPVKLSRRNICAAIALKRDNETTYSDLYGVLKIRRSRSRFLAPDQLVVCSYLRTVQTRCMSSLTAFFESKFFPSSEGLI